MRVSVLFALVILAIGACASPPAPFPTGAPEPVRIYGARPLVPEGWFESVHEYAQRCSGKTMPYILVEWYRVEPGVIPTDDPDSPPAGLWSWPNRIFLVRGYEARLDIILHELLHYVFQRDDELHADPLFQMCAKV